MMTISLRFIALSILFTALTVTAHEHHDELTEEESSAPVDAILWLHMILQGLVWGVLFPVGMVLGMAKSRWHVPLQSTGFALTGAGYILGHSHKGRQFLPNAHGKFANILFLPILLQLLLGVYLKLHIHEQTLRPWAVRFHGVIGKAYPVLAWVQMLFGVIAFRGYCRGDGLGQCLAHYIMGSGFIAYGLLMAILLIAGESWVRKSGRSPEWWDSWVIFLWGIVNTFTEHRGSSWSAKDMQHTSLGLLWWTGGLLGIYLSRNNQRNVVPGIIIIMTGWAMSEHAQSLMLSTKIHSVFGDMLILAGVTRIIEICFVPTQVENYYSSTDSDGHSEQTLASTSESPRILTSIQAFRYLPSFFLVVSGLLFIFATDEELQYASDSEMDHVTYVLLVFCLAFLLYVFALALINLYVASGRSSVKDKSATGQSHAGSKWYEPVPLTEISRNSQFVVGEE